MPLHGHVYTAFTGARGFDANVTITAAAAAAFRAHGYQFVVRYVRRDKVHKHDLTGDEAARILDAGLGLMAVQHVESEDAWTPSAQKGTDYGGTAADAATKAGLPSGVTLWCDLEGVKSGTDAQEVVEYCNNWHSAVAAEGFVPGLYVGYHAGLNRTQLYRSLRFTHYWGAYNLNADEAPAVRGLQMKQSEPRPIEMVAGVGFSFQSDVVKVDRLGGLPTLVAAEGWLEVG